MAKSYVCFDIGSENLKMAEFGGDSGKVQLKSFAVSPLDFKPGMTNEERNMTVAQTVRSILNANRIKGKSISISISGQSVFTRFVQLPAVDESKVSQIIKYEAQQQVPFPIEEVEWDYQIIGNGAEEEINVLLVAVKKEILMGLIGALKKVGCEVDTISVAPLSIYNCAVFNEDVYSGATAVIDLGAKTTSLIILDGEKFWSRNIPIGSDNITQSVAKELNLEPAEAEKLKREAYVELNGAEPPGAGGAKEPVRDADSAGVEEGGKASEGSVETSAGAGGTAAEGGDLRQQAAKLIAGVCKRLVSEVKRSVGFYRTHSKGSNIQRVLLSGGGLSLSNLREYFEGSLSVTVERMFPLKNLSVSPSIDRADLNGSTHVLCDVVGLGLRMMGKSRLSVNLLPKIFAYQKELSKKKVYIVGAALCLIASMVLLTLNVNRTRVEVHEKNIDLLEDRIEKLKPYKDSIQKVKQEISSVDTKLKKIKKLQSARLYWVEFIDTLKKKKPKYAWFTEIEMGGVQRSSGGFSTGFYGGGAIGPYGAVGPYGGAGPYGGGGMGPYSGGSMPGAGMGPYAGEKEVKGEKGTVELTGYLKMRKIATADTETALALQIEELKQTLENVKAKEDLELEWRRFDGISVPKEPTEKRLRAIHTVLESRKKQLEQQVAGYLEKNVIPGDFLTEDALDGLLDEAEQQIGAKHLDDLEKLRDYNGVFEAILSRFNDTAKSDFFGDIVPKKSDPLDFYPGVAKFVFKANLNRPIEF